MSKALQEGIAEPERKTSSKLMPIPGRMHPRVLLALVLLITFLAYIGTLGFEFVSDDEPQIISNRFLQSWKYVPQFFTGHMWSHLRPESQGNYYRPLALVWLFVNHLFLGSSAAWWHLTTVLAHIAATLMVYLLVNKVAGDRLTACVAAMIFGLHAVHIEAVAWVSGFTEPLLTVLFTMSFLCYVNFRRGGPQTSASPEHPRRWRVLSLVLYALALLSKETATVFPGLIIAYELIFDGSRGGASQVSGDRAKESMPRRPLVEKLKSSLVYAAPYLALTIIYLVARSVVLGGLSHQLRAVSPSVMLLTWPSLLWLYLRHLLWPFGLSAFYDTPYVEQPGLSTFVLPLVSLTTIAAGLLLIAKRSSEMNRRLIAFSAVLLVLPILPLLNLSVLMDDELVHDRYLYLPSIGFAILLALAVRSVKFGRAMLFGQPAVRIVVVLALICTLGFATSYQQVHWANNLVLYHHSLTCAPNNKVAANNLANELSKRGYYDEAIKLYQELLERDPSHWAAIYDLGCNYYLLGRYQEAEAYLVRGIEIRPREPGQYLTLAVTLQEMNRLGEAERAARQAIEIRPEGYGFHYELGDILKAQGNLLAAADEFRAEISFNPKNRDAHEQLAEIETRSIK